MVTLAATRGGWASLCLVLPLTLASCGQAPPGGGGPEADQDQVHGPPYSLTVSGVGFSTPESVLHEPLADVYLVANINGDPLEKDGNGYISRVSPEGNVLVLNWIDGGTPGVTLNAPKGMALVADTLFVADIDCIRRFHRVTGVPFQALCLEDATFLNDLAATNRGDLYFTDSGTDLAPGVVYFLRHTADVPQRLALADGTVLEGDGLGGPNGVFVDGQGLLIATFGSGELFRVTQEGEREQLLFPSGMMLDGIVSLEGEGILVSSWGDSAVYRIHPDGTVSPLIQEVETPADIGYDAVRNRLLIPLFRGDEILVLEIR